MDEPQQNDLTQQSEKKEFVPSPTMWALIWFAGEKVIGAIIGFIAVQLFTPIWKWILKKWNSEK